MRYLSVCSGIEAATSAWHPLGWTPLAFAEIDPFARAVLQHHYPDVPLHGDFTALRHQPWIVDADVLVGGTPCQAFSVAGLRRSLEDARGNLTLEFLRLADAIDDLRRAAGRPPVWVVWENVPGVLNTRDNAFGTFLGGLVGDDAAIAGPWTDAGVVAGPERVAAWRVLDAQFFGLAQRRRRVFVLARGGARGWVCADALLPLIESLSGHPAPRRTTGQGVTAILEAGARTGRSTDDVRAGIGISAPGDPMFTLQAGKQHGVHIAPTIPARRTAGRGFGTDFDCDGGLIPQVAPTLRAGGNQTGGHRPPGTDVDTVESLIPGPIGGVFDGPTHSLRADGFDASEDGTGRGTPLVPVTHALDSYSLGAVAFTTEQTPKWNADQALTLTQGSPTGGGHPQAVATHMAVRRLTPRECERLQGFPDDYTLVPFRNKPAADGNRYKALGNSMAVPVMRYLGERIRQVEETHG